MEYFLKYFPNTEVKDKNGRTPLDLACFKGETTCVECLMLHGANCETHDHVNQRTPIHAAAFNNNDECLKIMAVVENFKSNKRLEKSFKLNNINILNQIQQDNFFNCKLANLKDKYHRTPLMRAVEQGHISTISLLITQMGADVLAYDQKNRSALHRAVNNFIITHFIIIFKEREKDLL